ncbi:4-hydroxythreonine-4-phosphate dehydrogenase PdxA [Moraxella oblonga]|uniref:4-hydroxythreonine-4-phosphate dehydrogenase PdxA n=1 Tax=Moraxella oblonga TaxID=200413 RepID=UPI0008332591|nr:4-hydroxythreonine-4-phosphate dehydrogenase PdxA [Moraxella oblonga]
MKPKLITTGEPAGIGMDIVIDVLSKQIFNTPMVVCADGKVFGERCEMLYQKGAIAQIPPFAIIDDFSQYQGQNICLLNIPCKDKVIAGKLNVNNAHMVENQLNIAHTLAIQNKVSAIITAPIQKSVMIDAKIRLDNGDIFSGHTEYFMHKCKLDKVVMMLANAKMKVALVTTHIPLKDVPHAITADAITQTVTITHDALQHTFGITTPKILVCGLNPHAGEDGHLGMEEKTIINPTLQTFKDKGMDISLALPADTLFTDKYLQNADVVIAMYHDQGLAPLKSHGFGDTVNITLGLPYLRTSVDHGTALDLAGTGKASSSSLVQAIKMTCL